MRPLNLALSPELTTRLLTASEQQQRSTTVACCAAALRASDLRESLLDEALDDLCIEHYSPGMRDAVQALADWFDEEAGNSEERSNDPAHDPRARALRHARAASSLACALDRDTARATNEAVYEATHATASQRIDALIESCLDLQIGPNHLAARTLAETFWPRFIDVDGYVLLADHYSPENLVCPAVDSLEKSCDGVEDVFRGLGPDERLGVLVPSCDPIADVLLERLNGSVV